MKNNLIYIFAIIFAATFFTINSAGAGERVRVFEMEESGITIKFPMTLDEIAAQDAAYDKLISASKKSVAGSKNQVIVFEMGEGGQTVAFPMTAEEITAVNAENARLAAIKATRTTAPPEPVVRFELGESGYIIEFPAAGTEMEPGDSVIAGDITDNGGIRIQ
jgi:hypothetical protein